MLTHIPTRLAKISQTLSRRLCYNKKGADAISLIVLKQPNCAYVNQDVY
jgi:hypothetical protein